jgi:hypothetical protein
VKTWARLAWTVLLVGCTGQAHPLTPSEKTQCKLNLIADFMHAIPDEAIYQALAGNDPQPLTAYLLKFISPADVVELINHWKACSREPAETE